MTKNEVLAIVGGYKVDKSNRQFKLTAENERGELIVEVNDTNLACMGNALIALATAQTKLDKTFCRLLADCDKTSASKAFGFKNTADMAHALTGLDRKTMLIYIKVGKVFWNADGVKKPFVDLVSIAHLAQMQATISNEDYTSGIAMDLDFWQNFWDFTIKKYGRVIPVSKLNECLKAFRADEYPTELVTYDEREGRWFLFSIYDLGEWEPAETKTAENATKSPDKPEKPGESDTQPMDADKPSIDTIEAFRTELRTAISELFVDMESRLSDGVKTTAHIDIDAILKYLESATANEENA